jgi:hypothetical protein
MPPHLLLQDPTHICGQELRHVRQQVRQWHRRMEGGFGTCKGGIMTLLTREQLQQVLTFQQICQWCKGLCDFWQNPAVKIHHAQKLLQILDSVQPRKIKHDLQAVPERGNAGGAETVAEEVELRPGELALVQVDGKPIVRQDPEDGPQLLHVLVQVPARHTAIIYVNKNKQQLLKQIVLQPLECLSSITQAKRQGVMTVVF